MPWPWEVQHYDSGVPVESSWDRLVRTTQPFLAVGFALMAVATVRPMGLSGGGLVRLLLVLASMAMMLTVPIPDRLMSQRKREWIASACAVSSGLLMGLAGQGWGGTFGYMVGVHSGVRYPPRTAVRIIVLCAVVGVATSLTWPEHSHTPWWANLLVIVSVVPGMTRRTRQLTLAAANEVVEQTRRAAESEATSRALAERAAIARDIHDVLAHSLSGVNMQLSLAEALFDSDRTEPGRDAVRAAQKLVVNGIDEARTAVQTLRGDTVDPVEALDHAASGPGERFGVTGTPYLLPSRIVHTLVRIGQEALTNARRHAPGSPVRVALAFAPDAVSLDVRNGAGQGGGHEGSGLGLVGMRERAAQVAGSLDAGPLPADDPELPGGWLVHLDIPTPSPDPAQEDST